jgi:hypothetical protein
MKCLPFTLMLFGPLTSCDRQKTGHSTDGTELQQSSGGQHVARSAQNKDVTSESKPADYAADERDRILQSHYVQYTHQPDSALLAEAKGLTLKRDASGLITDEALSKLETIAPKLAQEGVLTDAIAAVPLEQLPRFKNLVFESLKMLAPQSGKAFNPKYDKAIRLGEDLDPKKLAPLVFEHLAIAPPYEFPTFELPGGWGDASLAQHAFKGTQGVIATTVVRYGDEALMARYRDQLRTASPQLQRVMAWALSRSSDAQDFEILWKLHSQTNDPAMADTAKRAMNAMARSMEALANDTAAKQTNRSSLSPDELKASANTIRERLKGANLSVQLTVWD